MAAPTVSNCPSGPVPPGTYDLTGTIDSCAGAQVIAKRDGVDVAITNYGCQPDPDGGATWKCTVALAPCDKGLNQVDFQITDSNGLSGSCVIDIQCP